MEKKAELWDKKEKKSGGNKHFWKLDVVQPCHPHLSNIINVHLALRVADGHLSSRVSPAYAVQCRVSFNGYACRGNLKQHTIIQDLWICSYTFLWDLCTSVSLLRFHRSNRPTPSTQANRAGCVGDHMTSYT